MVLADESGNIKAFLTAAFTTNVFGVAHKGGGDQDRVVLDQFKGCRFGNCLARRCDL